MAIKGRLHPFDWNVEMEVQLFYAMRGHKPVGVNRHFQMACILEKFKNAIQKDVSSRQIWDHLESMYDMAALDESEILPFPNDEVEFLLPESDFGCLGKKEIPPKQKSVLTSLHSTESSITTQEEKMTRLSRESSSNDEKESTPIISSGGGKHLTLNRLKELRESDGSDTPSGTTSNAAKRKRLSRSNQESTAKPGSPAPNQNTPSSAKRRRN